MPDKLNVLKLIHLHLKNSFWLPGQKKQEPFDAFTGGLAFPEPFIFRPCGLEKAAAFL